MLIWLREAARRRSWLTLLRYGRKLGFQFNDLGISGGHCFLCVFPQLAELSLLFEGLLGGSCLGCFDLLKLAGELRQLRFGFFGLSFSFFGVLVGKTQFQLQILGISTAVLMSAKA